MAKKKKDSKITIIALVEDQTKQAFEDTKFQKKLGDIAKDMGVKKFYNSRFVRCAINKLMDDPKALMEFINYAK